MKLCQFLKRWRQAYLDDKGDRLHAEAEVERNALCNRVISIEEAERVFHLNKEDSYTRLVKNFCEAASEAMEESLEEDCRGRQRYY